MSNSVRPHGRQPTRLPCPWDSSGKNTGVGCHFLLQCTKVKSEKWKWSRSVVSDPQWPHGPQPPRLLHPWDSPGKSTGVGSHCLLRYFILEPGNCLITGSFSTEKRIIPRSPTMFYAENSFSFLFYIPS